MEELLISFFESIKGCDGRHLAAVIIVFVALAYSHEIIVLFRRRKEK